MKCFCFYFPLNFVLNLTINICPQGPSDPPPVNPTQISGHSILVSGVVIFLFEIQVCVLSDPSIRNCTRLLVIELIVVYVDLRLFSLKVTGKTADRL